MKGIKEWMAEMNSNEELMKKFESLTDTKEIVNLAKKEGYNFTEDELMDMKMEAVSGGFGFRDIFNTVKNGVSKGTRFALSDGPVRFLRNITGNSHLNK